MMRDWSGICPWCGGGVGGGYSTTELLVLGFFGLLLLAGIVMLVVWIVRSSSAPRDEAGSPTPRARDDDAVRIARERFARGEISKDELEEITRTLGG